MKTFFGLLVLAVLLYIGHYDACATHANKMAADKVTKLQVMLASATGQPLPFWRLQCDVFHPEMVRWEGES